jgi:hypothetical protein
MEGQNKHWKLSVGSCPWDYQRWRANFFYVHSFFITYFSYLMKPPSPLCRLARPTGWGFETSITGFTTWRDKIFLILTWVKKTLYHWKLTVKFKTTRKVITVVIPQLKEGLFAATAYQQLFIEMFLCNFISAMAIFFSSPHLQVRCFSKKWCSTTAYHIAQLLFLSDLQLFKAMLLCNCISTLLQLIAEMWTKNVR